MKAWGPAVVWSQLVVVCGSCSKFGVPFWGPYMRDPIILGRYLVPVILGNSHVTCVLACSHWLGLGGLQRRSNNLLVQTSAAKTAEPSNEPAEQFNKSGICHEPAKARVSIISTPFAVQSQYESHDTIITEPWSDFVRQ